MARTTKQLSGSGKDKFLRAIVAEETTIPADAARRIGDALSASIADVRVRREAWERARSLADAPEPPAGVPAIETAPEVVPAEPADAAVTFDPFAFSAIAVLGKQGAAGLLARLAAIEQVADLLALAEAQHLTVDPAAASDANALRKAIVAATEARLAERRASAS